MTVPRSMTRSKPTLSEAQITRAVMEHWRARKTPGSRVAALPNMGAMGQYGLTAGLPDLIVIAKGLPIGLLELKREDGKLSAAQVEIRHTCIEAGAPHEVAYGLDQALAVLENWNAIRRAA